MKKLYIHIGTEKTGTTSLQYFLSENERALNKSGFSYFCNKNIRYFSSHNHLPLVASFFDECPYFARESQHFSTLTVLDQLRKDLLQCDKHAILSCEFFSSELRQSEHLRLLHDATKERDVRIICYIRPQDELLLSSYSTAVRSSSLKSFSIDDVTTDNFYLNYSTMLALWASVFGADKIIVRNYQRSQLRNGDIRADFLQVIDIENTSPFIFNKNRNCSLDARQLEIMRLINHYLPSFDVSNRTPFEQSVPIRCYIEDYLPQGESLQWMLNADTRKDILDRFAAANKEVEDSYMTPGALAGWVKHIPHSTAQNCAVEVNIEELCQVIIAQAKDIALLQAKTTAPLYTIAFWRTPPFVQWLIKHLLAIGRRP